MQEMYKNIDGSQVTQFRHKDLHNKIPTCARKNIQNVTEQTGWYVTKFDSQFT